MASRNEETIGVISLKWGDHLYQPSKGPLIKCFFIGKVLEEKRY